MCHRRHGCDGGRMRGRPRFPRAAGARHGRYTEDAAPAGNGRCTGTVGGAAQRFVAGRDIPGDWWTLFRSEPLDRLIRDAVADSPTLAAAEATLRQAQEVYAAGSGALLYPGVDANVSRDAREDSGHRRRHLGQPRCRRRHLQSLQRVGERLVRARRVRRQPARARRAAVAGRLPAATSSKAPTSRSRRTSSPRPSAKLAARADRAPRSEIIAARGAGSSSSSSGSGSSAPSPRLAVLAQSTQVAQTRATLPPLERELARNAAPARGARRPAAERSGAAGIRARRADAAAGRAGQPAVRARAPAARHPRGRSAAAPGERGDRRRHRESLSADHADRQLRRADARSCATCSAGRASGASAPALLQPLFHGGAAAGAKRRAAIAAYDAGRRRNTARRCCWRSRTSPMRCARSTTTRERCRRRREAEALVARDARSHAAPVPARRASSYLALLDRAAPVPAGAHRAGAGAGRALRRHRGAVPGAGRRLVESRRRDRRPAATAATEATEPARSARPQRERRNARHRDEEDPMKKRMVIMLIAVGAAARRHRRLQRVQGLHDGRSTWPRAPMPAATVSAMKADYQEWQPQLDAVGTLRAVRGVDVTTEIAGLVRSINFKSGDEVAGGPGAGAAQRRHRHRAAARARSRRRPRGDGLRARQGAARREGDQQGAGRRRRGRPQEQARAGRAAGGAGRQEDDPRAVRRQARHQHGQSGPVPQPGRQARHAADARPDLRRLQRAAAAAAADRRSGRRSR